MKRTLYILICLLTGIAAVSALAGTGCSPPAFDPISPVVLVGHHDITFVSHTFNGTNSTWTYNVTSGTQPSLSHWVIGWCAPDAILDASEHWVYAAPDPRTGITGTKFESGHEDGETRIVSFTLRGDYPEGLVEAGAVGGVLVSYGWITGPLCEPVATYTITATADAGGTITPSGAVVVNEGDSQAFNITPNAGYAIGDVLVDGTSAGAMSSYTFEDVASDHTIHANFEALPPVTYNLTISSTAGGSAAATASPTLVIGPGETKTMSDIPAGTVVSLVATPAAGYQFVDWTGDVGTIADVNATSTTITMNGNYSITANFEPIAIMVNGYGLTLTVSPGEGGTAIDLTGAGRYEEGATVAIRAIAADCYDFVNWTATAGVFADAHAAETTFTMPGQAVIVTANFEFIGNPTRALPDHVLPGETFEVTVTFAAPSGGFHAIALTDMAPAGWEVSVNVGWADPVATAVNTPAADTAAYVWYGPYGVCAGFTTVYEVRVPVNAEPGVYTFSGSLKYYIDPHPAPPYEQEVTGDVQVQVEEGETVRIAGVTRGVDGAVLLGAAVILRQNGEEIADVVTDQSGSYEFEFAELGDYDVVIHREGFRDEAQSVSVTTLAIYTVDFVADHGLIPDAPSISYVLACVSLWKFGEPPLQLSTFRVLDVVSAWMYPIA